MIDEDVILLDLDQKVHEPWSFLFFAGYLTAVDYVFKNRYYFKLKTPNKEISELYKRLVINAISRKFSSVKLEELHKALVNGNLSVFSEHLQLFVLNLCSSHDLHQSDLERSLHLFILGLLATLSESYLIESNLESGKGRCDICLIPRSGVSGKGVVLEFKKGNKEDLEQLAEEALIQIKTQDYPARLRKLKYEGPILCYGIASYKKELVVKLEQLPVATKTDSR